MLRITEIFYSLQGETSRMGLPTVFVRLTGCPLRCGYCDTGYAFSGGKSMSISEIMGEIASFSPRYVTVTGGEPLAQADSLVLLAALCDQGYSVSLETSGALDIAQVDARVSRIVDIKTPGSGEVEKNHWNNLAYLTSHDEIKFVLCDRADYDWARQKLLELKLDAICPVLFSPAYDQLVPTDLATWILQDQLPVRLQLQLHKLLWGECVGR
ncbi:7-carboxy-7-deazaguanine synthase QueE [Nitrosomonas sp.]|uniref:7-carboxy-7-deazaguanine synthase QueE n=1 Tax=Nitrosomonas sp. TaxID=42353 RepID=UPI003305EA71